MWSAGGPVPGASVRPMGRGSLPGVAIAALGMLLFVVTAAAGETTHTYPVALTISVDRPGHLINGTIVTDAPSEFCESSSIRIVRPMPGKDKVVKTVTPYGGEYHARSPKYIR